MAVKGHDFAVEKKRASRKLPDRSRHRSIGRRTIVAVAGEQRDPMALFVSQNSVAIVFLFVNPAWHVKWLPHQRGEHGLDAKGDSILAGRHRDPQWRAVENLDAIILNEPV